MSTKHTPGPWGLQESPNGGLLLIRGNDPDRMKRHPQTHLQIVPEADARLIAAAPELLAALLRGAELCERGHGREWAIEARAVIAKATGETK